MKAKLYAFKGQMLNVATIAGLVGKRVETVRYRLKHGIDPEAAEYATMYKFAFAGAPVEHVDIGNVRIVKRERRQCR